MISYSIMIRKFFYITFLILLVSFANTAKGQIVVIKGRIAHAGSPEIYLSSYFGYNPTMVASAMMDRQGNFTFKIPYSKLDTVKSGIRGLYRLGFHNNKYVDFVISTKEHIFIKSDYHHLNDSLQIEYSPENTALFEVNRIHRDFMDQRRILKAILLRNPSFTKLSHEKQGKVINEKYDSLVYLYNRKWETVAKKDKKYFAGKIALMQIVPDLRKYPKYRSEYTNESDFLQDHFFDLINFDDPELIHGAMLENRYMTYFQQYIPQTNEDYIRGLKVIMNKAYKQPQVNAMTIQFLMRLFDVQSKEKAYLYIVNNYTESCEDDDPSGHKYYLKDKDIILSLATGRTAPDIAVKDSSGKPIDLYSLVKRSKYTMILFWASWCPHCQHEVPLYNDIYLQFKHKGFQVYAVSVDNKKDAWENYIKTHNLSWVNVSALKGWNTEAVAMYDVKSTPTMFLLDNKGTILGRSLTPVLLEGRLKRYYGEK